jgi:ubiquinone/menaquinone biosynthesis C-methylase UbiE
MAVDTVVTTWTLCTIPDPAEALKEMKRVLKPRGTLIFIEHGWSPDPSVRTWQNLLNPIWKRLAGGCNMNRKIEELIAEAGFHITQLETEYNGLPRLLTYLYKGMAERPV